MRIRDSVTGLISALCGAVIFYLTLDFPSLEGGHPGPALFPRILAVLFVICGSILVFQDVRAVRWGRPVEAFPAWESLLNAVSVIAVVVLYIVLVDALGFILTGIVLFTPLMKKLDVSIWSSAILSPTITIGIYLLFHKMLMVPLPWGLIHW